MSKANRALGIIRNRHTYILRTLYVALVRPYLDHASIVWNSYFKKDIELIEGVQRRASRFFKNLKNLSYEERLAKLSLTTFEERRLRGYLIQVYKIIHEIENINLIKGFKFRDNNCNLRDN